MEADVSPAAPLRFAGAGRKWKRSGAGLPASRTQIHFSRKKAQKPQRIEPLINTDGNSGNCPLPDFSKQRNKLVNLRCWKQTVRSLRSDVRER